MMCVETMNLEIKHGLVRIKKEERRSRWKTKTTRKNYDPHCYEADQYLAPCVNNQRVGKEGFFIKWMSRVYDSANKIYKQSPSWQYNTVQ
mmetsp:Transcript_5948/g.6936  ORF Transcript_5948/g.6936 Transcript_5948/m.6936 type:complete len:90 (+) Transcript_5948:247-516(+)